MLSFLGMMTIIPTLNASDSKDQLDQLTKEQAQVQADIEEKSAEISDAQIELDALNSTIESNQENIEKLNEQAAEKQDELDDQYESIESTLLMMQKMHNQNAMLSYLTSDDEENFLIRLRNVSELTSAIGDNITTFSSDLQSLKSAIAQADSYQQQNKENQKSAATLLAEQQSAESELQTKLNSIDTNISDTKYQISLEEAAEIQRKQEEATAKAEAEEKAKAEEEANNAAEIENSKDPDVDTGGDGEDNTDVDVTEPEVVEPEVPETGGDSGYSANGDVGAQKNQLMASAGISSSDYQYVDYIITKESGWNYLAVNSFSGAYGLCQALPGSKMASAGSDWATNPETQISWCNSYATSRYGSWQAAYNFWLANNWW